MQLNLWQSQTISAHLSEAGNNFLQPVRNVLKWMHNGKRGCTSPSGWSSQKLSIFISSCLLKSTEVSENARQHMNIPCTNSSTTKSFAECSRQDTVWHWSSQWEVAEFLFQRGIYSHFKDYTRLTYLFFFSDHHSVYIYFL